MKKPNCYSCQYRTTIPGSAHSCCTVIRETAKELGMEDSRAASLETLISLGRANVKSQSDQPAVKLSQHGVDNGWAMWPLDFDPIWVESCEFESSKKEKDEKAIH